MIYRGENGSSSVSMVISFGFVILSTVRPGMCPEAGDEGPRMMQCSVPNPTFGAVMALRSPNGRLTSCEPPGAILSGRRSSLSFQHRYNQMTTGNSPRRYCPLGQLPGVTKPDTFAAIVLISREPAFQQ